MRSHLRLRSTVSTWHLSRRLNFTSTSVVKESQTSTFRPASNVRNDESVKDYSLIPGPKPLPLLGNSWRFLPVIGQRRIEEIDQVSTALHKEYGDIVKISNLLGRPDMVFVYDANEIERAYRGEEVMPHRPSMPSLNYYKHVLRKDFFGDIAGVIAVHGQKWYEFRSKVQRVVLQPRVVKLYLNDVEEIADLFVRRISRLKNEKQEVPNDFLNEIHLWSLESIAKIALDIRLGCLNENISNPDTQLLINAIHTFFKNVGVLELKIPFWKLFNTPTWNKYIHSLDTITNVTAKYISKALNEMMTKGASCDGNSSLVQRILASEPNNPKLASILALDMFLVGIDTTSAAIASILYQLSQNQDKQEILLTEINSVLSPGSNLSFEKFDEMPYLKACIKETLRMYPVVIGNGRCMTKDTTICGYNVPTGVQVVFQHYVISNSEKYFANPSKFEPERWLKANKISHHPFASLPFGFGKRMCLGRRFAELEIQTLIAKIIQSYKVEWHREKLEYSIQPMYLPTGPLSFTLVDRKT